LRILIMSKDDIVLTGGSDTPAVPSPETTTDILERIDDLLREQAKLREQIDAAKEQALQSHFSVDRRYRERRVGRERRRKDR
jgi:hypothetical protein